MFRDNLSVPVQEDFLILEDGTDCAETLVRNHHLTLHNIPDLVYIAAEALNHAQSNCTADSFYS